MDIGTDQHLLTSATSVGGGLRGLREAQRALPAFVRIPRLYVSQLWFLQQSSFCSLWLDRLAALSLQPALNAETSLHQTTDILYVLSIVPPICILQTGIFDHFTIFWQGDESNAVYWDSGEGMEWAKARQWWRQGSGKEQRTSVRQIKTFLAHLKTKEESLERKVQWVYKPDSESTIRSDRLGN